MKHVSPTQLLPVVLAVVLALAGCSSIGPRTVARDRFEYSRSIGESWKRQALLNIVKLRYMDPPIFVDVGQIVAGYTLETGASVGADFVGGGDNTLGLGGSAKYTDRPTITYTPMTGNAFIKSMLMPLPPDAVFFTIQAGWPADSVLGAALSSINGLKNVEATIAGVTPAEPDFLRVLELLRKIQVTGAVGIRLQPEAQKQHSTILVFRTASVSAATLADVVELRRLLRLNPEAMEFKLVFGTTAANDHEVAVTTRSMMHLMANIAATVEVPAEDVAQGRATPGAAAEQLRVRCSKGRPADAFVAVAYRDRWFWINDRDLQTKRVFAFIMMLFTLADTGEKGQLPLLTISTQ